MSPKSNLPLKFFFQNLVSTSLHTEVVKKRKKKFSKNYVSGWFLREVAHIGTVIARGRGRARIPPAADDRTTAFSRSNQAEMPARPRTRRASSDLQTESSPQVGMLGDTIGSTQRSSLSTSSDAATSIEHSHPWSTAEWTPRPRKRLASTRDESTVQLQWAEAHQPDLSSAQGNRDKSPYGFTTPSSSRYPSVFTPRNRRAARPRPAATDGAKLYMFASDATAQVNPLATPAAQSGGSVVSIAIQNNVMNCDIPLQ